MPKTKSKDANPTTDITQDSRDQSTRHSLPKSTSAEATTSSPFRHTQSHNYGNNKKKVKTKLPPVILELDSPDGDEPKVKLDAINEKVRLSVSHVDERKTNRHGKSSRKNSQANSHRGSGAYDNAAYVTEGVKDGHLSRSNSVATSVRSSTRPPSVQSLTVVREQYCCCSRWTPCERTLFAAVGVLGFIIIALVIAVALLARGDPEETKKLLARLT